ncbi:hypothetical protein COU60_04250 [Candidatus Pacearchaeota archaeon CG10_big_fil_rev_8_21_14_0_10_34_76]|nr:MAG: hypothetical protein COU60_04250 [Candidatus Pacearchaeota archaeon CG10_big_fil_rev_8_21_14_0_10_34_76]
MKFNPKLKQDIAKYYDYVLIVEGEKDVEAMQNIGFDEVYPIHKTSVPLRERVAALSEIIGKKKRVCILTDFDKKGKKLYMTLKPMFQEQGMKLDSSLRGLFIKAGISHIEGIDTFLTRVRDIN